MLVWGPNALYDEAESTTPARPRRGRASHSTRNRTALPPRRSSSRTAAPSNSRASSAATRRIGADDRRRLGALSGRDRHDGGGSLRRLAALDEDDRDCRTIRSVTIRCPILSARSGSRASNLPNYRTSRALEMAGSSSPVRWSEVGHLCLGASLDCDTAAREGCFPRRISHRKRLSG